MPQSIVVVTQPEFVRAEAVFTSAKGLTCVVGPPDEDALAQAVLESGARHVVLGPLPYRDVLYTTLAAGAVVARFGVGHDGIDKARATRAGLLCTNTPDVLHQSVAELAMLFVCAAARHLTSLAADIRQGVWRPHPGGEIQGKTLAVVGCGRIGSALARIASRGFDMRVVGCRRPGQVSGQIPADFDAMTDDFAVAVRDADYVSLHMPATLENVRFIDRDRLSMLRVDAWLINTGRGALVDEAALYDALLDQRIGGAALDVFEREPYEPVDPARDLRTRSNVILLPHVGSNTREANHRMAERALQNIAAAEAGNFAGMDLLNPEVLAG